MVVVVGSFVVHHSLAFAGGLGVCKAFTWRRGRLVRYDGLILGRHMDRVHGAPV